MGEIEMNEKVHSEEQDTNGLEGKSEKHRRSGASLIKMLKSRALLIFYGLIIVGVIAAAILLCIFTFFKINTVNIEGSGLYTNEEIMETAGINIGDSLVFADTKAAEKRLESELLYIENVSLNKSIPYTLNIKITQAVPTYSVEYKGKYIYVSSKGKILEISSEPMAGSMTVNGGDILETEGYLSFADEKVNEAFDELILAIGEAGSVGIGYIDISNVFDINAEYDGRVKLKFGSSQDLTYKMSFAVNIINNENGIGPEERGTLDLSLARDTNKSYFAPEVYANNSTDEEGTVSEFTPGEVVTYRGEDIPDA